MCNDVCDYDWQWGSWIIRPEWESKRRWQIESWMLIDWKISHNEREKKESNTWSFCQKSNKKKQLFFVEKAEQSFGSCQTTGLTEGG